MHSAPGVGLLVATATAPGTFTSSLSARSAVDQGIVTGLTTGLHHLLSVSTQDVLEAVGRFLADGSGGAAAPSATRRWTFLVDCAAVPLGLAVTRSLPPRAGDSVLRGAARQIAWRLGATGLGGALLIGAETGVRALDTRLGARGRLAAVPLAVPVGLGFSYVMDRRRVRPAGAAGTEFGSPSALRSLAVAAGTVGSLAGGAYGEHLLADLAGRQVSKRLPGPPEVWRALGHGAVLTSLGVGVSTLWHRAMQRLEAGTITDAPVLEPGEAGRWVPSTVSGGPGSLVSWASLGREGRRHALLFVRPQPVPDRPRGVPDLSIETVMGEPARAAPVQVYVGLDSAASARERVDLALAEMERAGAFDRSLLVLVSPTGTGYVNYVAVAAVQYLALGDVATVTLQYSRRPSPLSLGMIKAAREQNRLLWLRVLERVRERPGPRPRVVLFGESLGAHTSQDVFLHWGTLGLEALGIDRALWIGTPYGSKWMQQVTGVDRLDVDRDAVVVVNDLKQLEQRAVERRARPRFVLLSHDNDGVTKFGLDLLWSPPGWLGPDRPRVEQVDGASPRGIPPGMRWRPITTFFQSLVDMKNAQIPGEYRAWAHDYRTDLPRFLSEVYELPAAPEQLVRIEEALRLRETVRERLFSAGDPADHG
ncbi:MAG: alpha/beta-hydrolase family protein [Blastococcus sp.]